VLVHRIAWLIQVENDSPYGILAVTFYSKATIPRRRVDNTFGPVGVT